MLVCYWCHKEHDRSPTFGENQPVPENPGFTYKHCNACRSHIGDNGLVVEYALTPIIPGQISMFGDQVIYPTGRQLIMPLDDVAILNEVLGSVRAEQLVRTGLVLLTQGEWRECNLPDIPRPGEAPPRAIMPPSEIKRVIDNYHRHKVDPQATAIAIKKELASRPPCMVHHSAPGCH